jgi:hypothetical protein
MSDAVKTRKTVLKYPSAIFKQPRSIPESRTTSEMLRWKSLGTAVKSSSFGGVGEAERVPLLNEVMYR